MINVAGEIGPRNPVGEFGMSSVGWYIIEDRWENIFKSVRANPNGADRRKTLIYNYIYNL